MRDLANLPENTTPAASTVRKANRESEPFETWQHWKIRCTAHAKTTGEQCGQTATPGFTKCRNHGGTTVTTHSTNGRYSQALIRYPELREAYERHRDDPKIEELGNEAALLRAMLERYLSEHAGTVDQDLISQTQSLTDSVSKVIERRHRIKNGITVSVRDFESLVVSVVAMVGDVFGREGEQWGQFCERLSRLSPSGVSLGMTIAEEVAKTNDDGD